MCRFVAYQGPPLSVDTLLYQPNHSLIKQSYNARERAEPLNGDGFGLGWYEPAIDETPAVFTSVSPAWNNRNLRYMAPKLVSPAICAHVRAASNGDVAEHNCHPFHWGNLLMMHNGHVAGFDAIKRRLCRRLSDARFNWVDGQTDSQYLFALFLDHYLAGDDDASQGMAAALTAVFQDVAELKREAGVNGACTLNMVVMNGEAMVASRYIDDPEQTPLSLHYATGSHYFCDQQGCAMLGQDPQGGKAAIIASEPLTEAHHHWRDVPAGHFVLAGGDHQVRLQEIRP